MTIHKHNCQTHIDAYTALLAKWWAYRRDAQAGQHARSVIRNALRMIRTWRGIANKYPEVP